MFYEFEGCTPVLDPSAYVHPAATLIGRVWIGEHSSVWPGASLRGDVGPIRIGACTSIQDNVVAHTTGGLSETDIGSRVTVGHGAILHGCKVADDCLVGMGAILMDNCEIGPWTIVAAGSLVPPNKRFEGNVLLVGRPAKVVRPLLPEELEWITYAWKNYVDLLPRYLPSGT